MVLHIFKYFKNLIFVGAVTFLIFSSTNLCFSNSSVDSLWLEWKKIENVNRKTIIYNKIVAVLGENETFKKTIIELYKQNAKKGIRSFIKAVTEESSSWFSQSNYKRSAMYAEVVFYFDRHVENPDKTQLLIALTNYSDSQKLLGNHVEAIEVLTEARNTAIQFKNEKLLAAICFNLGTIYYLVANYENASEQLDTALSIYNKLDEITNVAQIHFSLGSIQLAYGFENPKHYKTAKIHFKKSYEFNKQAEDNEALQNMILYCLANCDIHMNADLDTVLNRYLEIYKNVTVAKNDVWISYISSEISGIYILKENWSLAKKYAENGFDVANKNNLSKERIDNLKQLVVLNKQTRNFKKAFEYNNILSDYKDSLKVIEVKESIAQKELDFELEKKVANEKANYRIELAEQELRAQEKDHRNNIIIFFIGCGFVVITIFIMLTYRSLKAVQRQKKLLESQHKLIQVAHDEIKDSIIYAKRIQKAILPQDSALGSYFPDSFVYYQPKDIVAGDFYWIEPVSEGVFFAVGDCTGHGVPGAMVSVICNGSLNRSVREHKIESTGKVLDKTRDLVIQEFEKSDENVQDGMDISLCKIEDNKLHFSGANNPLWLIRNGELQEVKGCKQPIGKYENKMPFSTHILEIETNDLIYLFSDGFADQFGGDRNKKYKSSNFKKFLLSIHSQPMSVQSLLIEEEFDKWKGKSEQLDDVCVMGIRV